MQSAAHCCGLAVDFTFVFKSAGRQASGCHGSGAPPAARAHPWFRSAAFHWAMMADLLARAEPFRPIFKTSPATLPTASPHVCAGTSFIISPQALPIEPHLIAAVAAPAGGRGAARGAAAELAAAAAERGAGDGVHAGGVVPRRSQGAPPRLLPTQLLRGCGLLDSQLKSTSP